MSEPTVPPEPSPDFLDEANTPHTGDSIMIHAADGNFLGNIGAMSLTMGEADVFYNGGSRHVTVKISDIRPNQDASCKWRI